MIAQPAVSEASRSVSSPWSAFRALSGERPADVELLKETRPAELQQVIDIVGSARASILYAPSGNGKSSLVYAGVEPHFRERGYAVFRIRPRPPFSQYSPSKAFKECILRYQYLPDRRTKLAAEWEQALGFLDILPDDQRQVVLKLGNRVEEELRRVVSQEDAGRRFAEVLAPYSEASLREFTSQVQQYVGMDIPMLFICDQFEELFVHFHNTAALRTFVEQIGEVYGDSKLRAKFLFSMREDLVGKMIEFRTYIPDIFNFGYKLPPLIAKRAKVAISLPAQQRGVYLASSLVDRIASDLSSYYESEVVQTIEFVQNTNLPTEQNYVELPAIQIVMNGLWQEAEGSVKDLSYPPRGVETNNYAADMLHAYLPSLLKKMEAGDPPRLSDIRRDILYLLTDGRLYRRALGRDRLLKEVRAVYPRELDPVPIASDEIDKALKALIDSRIVLVEETQDGHQYELAHDFLVRAVVTCWSEQDRRRFAAIGRQQKYEETERQRNLVLKRLSALLLAGAIVAELVGYIFAARGYEVWAFLPFFVLLVGSVACASYSRKLGVAVTGSLDVITGIAFLASSFLVGDERLYAAITFAVSTFGIFIAALVSIIEPGRYISVFAAELMDGMVAFALLMVAVLTLNRFTPYGAGLFAVALAAFLSVAGPSLVTTLLRTESIGYRIAGLRFSSDEIAVPKRLRLFARGLMKACYSVLLAFVALGMAQALSRYDVSALILIILAAVFTGSWLLDASIGIMGGLGGVVDRILAIKYVRPGDAGR